MPPLLCFSCMFSWLRMDDRSPSSGCCTVALVVPPGSCLDISACGSWGGQCEPQMRLKLCLVWAGVISSRSKWSMRRGSLLFFPVMTSWAVKPKSFTPCGSLGWRMKKQLSLVCLIFLPFVLHMQTWYPDLRLWVSGREKPCLFASNSMVWRYPISRDNRIFYKYY